MTALEAESDTERMFALGGSLATLTVDLVVVFDSVNRNRMWVEREEGVDSCGFARSDAGSGTSRVAAFSMAVRPWCDLTDRRRSRSGERTLPRRRVRSLGGVRERRRGLAADNRGGLVNQFVVV